MATDNKIRFPLWLTPKTMESVKEAYKADDCRSQSEFIEKAVNAYLGYLQAKDTQGMLPNSILSAMKAIENESDNRQNRILFKLAVEMAMMMNILAAYFEVNENNLESLRYNCIQEVKKINGMLRFEDAYLWQSE